MPTVHIDAPEVRTITVATADTDGSDVDLTAVLVPVLVPDSEVADWLSRYDPDASASPNAADSRVIARAVLDALAQSQS